MRSARASTVNLELPLRAADRLGGHFVQGHVDGVATVRSVLEDGFARVVTFDAPPALLRYVVEKGSIAVDGVSLTVSAVDDDSFRVPDSFSVSLNHERYAPRGGIDGCVHTCVARQNPRPRRRQLSPPGRTPGTYSADPVPAGPEHMDAGAARRANLTRRASEHQDIEPAPWNHGHLAPFKSLTFAVAMTCRSVLTRQHRTRIEADRERWRAMETGLIAGLFGRPRRSAR